MVNDNILLTIAIPTYNRSDLLSRCLKYINLQKKYLINKVEILISDNASIDNTEEVVKYYISLGLNIRYFKNIENKGADFNIMQCYLKARGKYVVAFGDDDVLYINAIPIIIKLIDSFNDFGVLYLNWELIKEDNVLNSGADAILYYDYEEFCNKVNHNLTFISGNIINVRYIKNTNFNKYVGTSLIQLPIILKALMNAPYNIFIKQPLVGVQPDNSGGFSICKVFGENINSIFNELNINSKTDKIFRNIMERLLIESFPTWIYRIKVKEHSFSDSTLHKPLSVIYSKFTQYWLFIYPLIVSNKFLVRMIWPIYKFYIRAIDRLFFRKKETLTHHKIIKIRFDE